MIIGDTADSIKGLENKGKSFCEKHFKDFKGDYPLEVLKIYIEHYKDQKQAIDEFYKHYKCLHILKEDSTFVSPTPVIVDVNKLII
jgi:hypothetical protein